MTVILVAGLPAAGKSTTAADLAAALHTDRVDKDEINAAYEQQAMLSLTGDPFDRDSAAYRERVLPVTLAAITEAVHAARAAGTPLVVECPFLAEAREAMREKRPLADIIHTSHGWRPDLLVWMHVDPPTQRERFAARGSTRDAPKLDDFPAYRATLGAAATLDPALVDLHIDTTDIKRPAR